MITGVRRSLCHLAAFSSALHWPLRMDEILLHVKTAVLLPSACISVYAPDLCICILH